MARAIDSSGLQRSATLPWLVLVLGACSSSPVVLSSGSIAVTFETDETCGFENPYVADAKGCRMIDEHAFMCKGFGVIDGVLFAGGCEAPAEAHVQETRGTMPVAPAGGAEEVDADEP